MQSKSCEINSKDVNSQDLNSKCLCSRSTAHTPYDGFFAQASVFLSDKIINNIGSTISILEKIIKSPDFKKVVFKEDHSFIEDKNTEGGILMSYDFHLDVDTPKLIEINTNAGGIFLNYELLKITKSCCTNTKLQSVDNFEEKIVAMFRGEFAKKSNKQLEVVAIVDESPEEQFLYPEFLICKEILEKNGIKVFISDPKDLKLEGETITYNNVKIDLIYNRLTDFYFEKEENKNLKFILESNNIVISPSPQDHLLFADKINFKYFQDTDLLDKVLSVDEKLFFKNVIPETKIVDTTNEEYLWANRKKYFFKPFNGFGGGGAYNGRGLTKRVWENIKTSNYIAQEIIAPNLKLVDLDGDKESYKFDIRAYTYKGEILLLAARLYQGQTTNFRTKGGGFAPIIII